MRRWLRAIGNWFEFRLGLRDTLVPLMRHPVPQGVGWFYVFGSATMTLLMVQIVTGVLLAMFYVPSAGQAYDSLLALNYDVYLGWLLRALHNCSASGMIILLLVHMTQVFLFGAFKYPRELTWLVGVVLLGLTLGMGFTGQVLRWDQTAYWSVGVGAAMAGRVPFIGPQVVDLLLGGPIIGSPTLSRFFTLHVFVLPGLLLGALAVHLYLVVKQGVSEPPVPGKLTDPATYHEEYERELKAGQPFYPEAVIKDAIACALAVLGVVIAAVVIGPEGPGLPADPTLIQSNPRPDWYFWWLFALLAMSPPQMETPLILVLPVVLFGILMLVPFIAGKGERAATRRPVAVLSVLAIYTVMGVLTWAGHKSDWSPVMDAWSRLPVPRNMVESRTPLQIQGAIVFQNKQCRNCHSLDGSGGKRGPDLTEVATRLTRGQLDRQVIQGSSNMPEGLMPAYGNQLRPEEVKALVAFLETLRPPGQAPAREPVQPPR